MDSAISIGKIMAALSEYGPFSLVIIFWFFDIRTMRRMAEEYRKEITDILTRHEDYMREMRSMYDSNVRLVEAFNRVAGDFRDVVIMNTQGFQKIYDAINANQYCPQVRLEKRAKGAQA